MLDPLKNQNFKDTEALKPKAPKSEKERRFRAFRKDIKRIIWPSGKKSWVWFGLTVAFVVVFAIFFFVVTLLFTNLWNAVGIKL
ncbi:preprotein translocase subunit SecE [Mycoplasma sp. 1573]